ncbi:hypothetical protein ACCO45_008714 [Purpureocillium lilacinum]|uniref:Uncharacterized protein n=1 Tax=Purpureocillium lilacinum TaxID=33203 RepID=A0ACC4DRR1_PURLI
MTSTILIVGATGNTGRSVVETLSELLNNSSEILPGCRILALTRSLHGPAAEQLTRLPRVEVVEQNWVQITADWLRQNRVVRAFIASHNLPTQFAEESAFHLAALQAGVEYVVRISTTAANVRPDCPAYYPRTHWAIETLLSSPEFQNLQWTSLQPNIFSTFYIAPAAELVNNYRESGKQGALRLLASRDSPVGVIDPADVGVLAAHLLVTNDTSKHNKAKYILNGPEDITGQQIVKMVEDQIGTRVTDVRYQDTSVIDEMAAQNPESRNIILSAKHAPETAWAGECTAATTSKEVLELAAPKNTPADMFNALLRA